ncbi:predicted protein [Nematostella vectensis]|uniref:Uncharacterized protein n=1 Tax=Nematostella vectensis TaxID=45351 RepID=A7S7X4_NEMVE|nr:predicted protein [Nematostella vectensis]|eukprot:XP_001632212.1 predicted protein [Nematostella vectensis]
MYFGFCFIAFICVATIVSSHKAKDKTDWNTLDITFGKFDKLPLGSRAAGAAGWSRDASCSDKPRNSFQGYRYQKDGDITTRLLYDCDGYIAGAQTTITPMARFPTVHNSHPWLQNQDGTVSATMYFRDPKRICLCRKKPCKPKDKPIIGDRLWLQMKNGGEKPKFMEIPLNVDEFRNTPWVEGECVRAMGVHYHYNISKTFDCDYALPVFLLVDKTSHKVHGFGWAVPLKVEKTNRWEHPPPAIFGRSIKEKDMPNCIVDYPVVSVQHIYFKNPLAIGC